VSSRPPIGSEVVLERAGSTWVEAEVAGWEDDQLVLTLTDDSSCALTRDLAGETTSLATEAILTWHTERGVFRAPVVVAASASVDGQCVRATFREPAVRTQRREYVRLPMDTQMTLSHSGGTARGRLVDLSEAALRIRLPVAKAPTLQPGDEVRSVFTLHHTGFMLHGTVLREQPSDEEDTIDVVVMLDIPARTANDLRRNVVFEQIERQAGSRP
jgi:hypothetical protein